MNRLNRMALVALLCCQPVLAADNADVNAIYERMTEAYAALDSAAFADIYAADGAYLRSGENPMLLDIDSIIDNYENFFSGVRDDSGRLELRFRVIKRDCSGTICSDVGWYKLNRYDRGGAVEWTSYGRFLTTPGQSVDGLWRFIADLDSDAEATHWESAEAVSGLHFDE